MKHVYVGVTILLPWHKLLITALVTLALVGSPRRSNADEADGQAIVERILAAMRQRQNALKTVRYTLEGRATVPKGFHSRIMPEDFSRKGVSGDVPAEDYVYPQATSYAIDFEKNRLRREARGEVFEIDEIIWHPAYMLVVFDGERMQFFEPHEENTSPMFTPGEFQPELTQRSTPGPFGIFLSKSDESVFLSHARFPTKFAPEGTFERLRLPLDARMLRWHGRAALDGRECFVLRTPAIDEQPPELFYEYWIDASRLDEVLRERDLLDGREVKHIDIAYGDTPVGRWLTHYSVEELAPDGSRGRSEEMAVTAFEADPVLSAELFHIEPRPGMIVRDDDTDEVYRYGEPRGAPDDASRSLYRSPFIWLVVTGLGLLLLVLAIRWNRKKHR